MDIRNFCIIAHIDHGKSTLADRMIEQTGTLQKREMKAQLLDSMELERERGITIKLQPVRMRFNDVQLNLIDTPGHTDFRYEVSRSLAACEGAILLVDAAQGIQAQTIAVLYMAMEHDLTIIPVLNKIDLPAADPERVSEEVVNLVGCKKEDILKISAKDGSGVKEVLEAVIDRVKPPENINSSGTRALIFDAVMDKYRGTVAYVRMVDGTLKKGQKINCLKTGAQFDVLDLGHFSPKYVSDSSLSCGEIGYVVTGGKEVTEVRTGDTISSNPDSKPLPGYKVVQPMVFAGLYPSEADDYPLLRESLEKLSLNDAALNVEPERNVALGNGFRVGFLGLLHMDIVQERLEREHDCNLVITAPSVLYEVKLQVKNAGEIIRTSLLKDDEKDVALISNPADFPDPTHICETREPWVKMEILCRNQDVGAVMTLTQDRRGVQTSMEYLEMDRILLHFEMPLQSIVLDFFDRLKSTTAGYASMSYEPMGYKTGDLVKLDILLLGESAGALSSIVHRSEANSVGSIICKKLKEVLPKAQYQIPIQAAINSKVVARETLSAFRKDVTSGLYGGDVSRKRKQLQKQKKGKKRLKQMGKVTLTQDAFLSVLKR
ncbi:elongation factor 4 [Candidatus Peregrinibacteria bacterium]|jgi:GTP-binding protein LepA|nr:elongation factor 4 [Candidatus Peregrinibacteria bacterium]MBT3598906.1 elongation factor 4 [Candidatus Peregrinibacteria bacterium]MBT4367311.1 elongation factor 4 [Candidatus Peregrinibacteria bacterium]MBT4585800.1 elongation factor 4 [Candidatus Peregrinibacteria bacterium]MBT6730697.1 elongation factor 4 [Candidatus Peregrinibacteria bacterium]